MTEFKRPKKAGEFPVSEPIVAVVPHGVNFLVATTRAVYVLDSVRWELTKLNLAFK